MGLFENKPYAVKEILSQSMVASVSISPAGILVPLLDTTAITAIWSSMLYRLAKYHDVTLTSTECAKIITACGTSIFGYLSGSKILTWMLNLIPGIGTLGAMGFNVVLNGYYTYAIGDAFHNMLDEEDIDDMTISEMAKLLRKLFVPIPSLSTLKEVFDLMKDQLTS